MKESNQREEKEIEINSGECPAHFKMVEGSQK